MIASASSKSQIHCKNLEHDRSIGKYWEKEFCRMAANLGKSFTPMQIGRESSVVAYKKIAGGWNHYTLPDITIWTSPGEHHEIKHKNSTGNGRFGLEVYRFDALLWFANETKQIVMYTIHNHDLAGGKYNTENDISHWITASISDLRGKWSAVVRGKSWVNGIEKEVPIYYWNKNLWRSLGEHWNL